MHNRTALFINELSTLLYTGSFIIKKSFEELDDAQPVGQFTTVLQFMKKKMKYT